MLSPAKCESEDPTAQLDLLHSSPRSEPERLSLVLSLPNPAEAEMSTSRRSTRNNCNSPKEIGGGEGAQSPRITDNVSSVPITGKSGSSKRKISSAPVKVSCNAMQCRLVRSYSSLTLMDVCFLLWIDAERFWRIVIRVSQSFKDLISLNT